MIDQQPKKLTESQSKSLQILSKQVIRRLELQLSMQVLKDSIVEEQHNKDLLEQAEIMKNAFYDSCEDYFLLLNNQFEIGSFNASSVDFFNKRINGAKLQKGPKIFEYLIPLNVSKVKWFLEKAQEG